MNLFSRALLLGWSFSTLYSDIFCFVFPEKSWLFEIFFNLCSVIILCVRCKFFFWLLDIGLIKASSGLLEKEDDGDDQTGGFSALPPASTQQPFYDGPMPTPRQKPFQSGSTPVHLMHRFMVNLCGYLDLDLDASFIFSVVQFMSCFNLIQDFFF